MLNARIYTAYASLWLECLFDAFFALIVWCAVFFCIALIMSPHETLAISFWSGVVILCVAGSLKLKPPSKEFVQCHIETASGLLHQPLRSRNDRPASGYTSFWDIESLRRRNDLSRLRFVLPDFHLTQRDPYALRIALVLIMVTGWLLSPDTLMTNLRNGLGLDLTPTRSAQIKNQSLKITLIPPAYSGLAPRNLSAENQPVEIIAGSHIEIDFPDALSRPAMKTSGDDKPFKRTKYGGWRLSTKIPKTEKLSVTVMGWPVYSIRVKWIEDHPPVLTWKDHPIVEQDGQLRLPMVLTDDYGIKTVSLRAILAPGVKPPIFGRPILIEKKILLRANGKAMDFSPLFDTTGHVWSGQKVTLLVEVKDFAGNTSEAAPRELILPTRIFQNPVAARLAAIRQDTLSLSSSPKELEKNISSLLFRPERYEWDIVTTLGLKSIAGRIYYAQALADLESAAAIMWSVAMRIEKGRTADTEHDMRQSLADLEKTARISGDPRELIELLNKLMRAMQNHVAALSGHSKSAALDMSGLSPTMPGLSKLLEDLKKDLYNGDRQSALEKISALSRLTDALSNASTELPKEIREKMERLKDLEEIISLQQKLLDDTRSAQNSSLQKIAVRQAGINDRLDRTVKRLSSVPDQIRSARQDMQASKNALSGKDGIMASKSQQSALEKLKKSQQSMRQEMQKVLKQITVISFGASGQNGDGDPLGRSGFSKGDAEITDDRGQRKTEKIVRELRERESDLTRPAEEKSYYERLLKEW